MPTAPSIFWIFIAGMATVITPCVLPILPAVLSGMILILFGLMMLFEIDKYLKKTLLPYFPVYI